MALLQSLLVGNNQLMVRIDGQSLTLSQAIGLAEQRRKARQTREADHIFNQLLMQAAEWHRATTLLESFTQADGAWGDLVAVFLKDASLAARYPDRMLDHRTDVINGRQEAKGEQIFHPLKTNNGEARPARRKGRADGTARPLSERLRNAIRRK